MLQVARHPYPDTKAERIVQNLQEPQLKADPVTTRAKSRLMLALAVQLLPLSTQSEPWAADYYARKRREGKTHTMAVRALGNQWGRIIYALWNKGETCDPAVFLRAQRDHARRAA